LIAMLGILFTAAGVLIAIEPPTASLEAFTDLRRRRIKYYFGATLIVVGTALQAVSAMGDS
jgi:hypothetical protein